MDKSKAIVIGVLVALVGVAGALKWSEQPPPPPPPDPAGKAKAMSKTPPKPPERLKVTEMRAGKGKTAKIGDRVTVHYRGTLKDGKVFDESYKKNQPFVFTLGRGEVIRGWDLGVVGMLEGGKRKLVVPGHLAYGPNPPPGAPIPPDATLIFEVEMLKVTAGPAGGAPMAAPPGAPPMSAPPMGVPPGGAPPSGAPKR